MNIDNIKNNLISEIEKLIKIIEKEYPDLVDIPNSYDLNKMVHVEETGTISLFVKNKNFYFPLDAFKVLKAFKKIPGFGMIKNHKTYNQDNMIINNNTYITYIKHVFLKGLTPEEYFKENLLHETLHFCGSGGGTAIREGINELKTRQLAKKYGLLTSSCGYPKETKIAYELEQIFGEEIINKISFSKNYQEIRKILNSVSPEAATFFFNLEETMEKEFHTKYMKYHFPGLTGPFKKTKKYNAINYTKAYTLIEEYKKNMHTSIKIPKDNNNYQLSKSIQTPKQISQNQTQIEKLKEIKNQAIAYQNMQQKQVVKPKKLVKTSKYPSNKGYINFTILLIIISISIITCTIIIYSFLK